MRQPAFFHGKKIGEIDIEKKVLIIYRTRAHIFHLFGEGTGLSNEIIDFLLLNGIEDVMVVFENKDIFYTSLNHLILNGEQYTDMSNGFEDHQTILPMNYWTPYRENKYEIIKV